MYDYRATLVKVIDGDTVDLLLDRGFYDTSLKRFRLARINTPERGQPGWQEAIDFVKQWFAGASDICVRSYKADARIATDKYGRFVAMIYRNTEVESLNDAILEAGLAVKY